MKWLEEKPDMGTTRGPARYGNSAALLLRPGPVENSLVGRPAGVAVS